VFTRYWRVRTDTDPEKLVEVAREMAKIIEASTVPLANFEGEPGTKPQIDLAKGMVFFNGVGVDDEGDAYESFYWPPDLNYPSRRDPQWTFGFCKTGRLPYDEVVSACLLAAKAALGEQIEISSDGGDPYGPRWGEG
jgi:hypothetical protein